MKSIFSLVERLRSGQVRGRVALPSEEKQDSEDEPAPPSSSALPAPFEDDLEDKPVAPAKAAVTTTVKVQKKVGEKPVAHLPEDIRPSKTSAGCGLRPEVKELRLLAQEIKEMEAQTLV